MCSPKSPLDNKNRNARNMLFSWLHAADQCFWGLIRFLKAPRPPKPPFHSTLVSWNIFFFPSFKLGLWLKTKGRLSQRARLLLPALRNCSQQITVNTRTKASSCAGQLTSKHPSTALQAEHCDACGHNKRDRFVSALCSWKSFFFFSFA